MARYRRRLARNYRIRDAALALARWIKTNRTEAQFCSDEAERLLMLAKACADLKLRDQLAVMANEWIARSAVKKATAKTAL